MTKTSTIAMGVTFPQDWGTTIWDYFPTSTSTIATYWNEQAKISGSFPPYNIVKIDRLICLEELRRINKACIEQPHVLFKKIGDVRFVTGFKALKN